MRGSENHIRDYAGSDELVLIMPSDDPKEETSRLGSILGPCLEKIEKSGIRVRRYEKVSELEKVDLRHSRILFAIALSEAGVNMEYYRLLEYLRANPMCLEGSVGGIMVDGRGEFYTKAIARRFAFSANMTGCAFPGKPLVEATGSLGNFGVLSRISGKEPIVIYKEQTENLIEKLLEFAPRRTGKSRILAVHASERRTSNTLLLWDMIRRRLEDRQDIENITEISLQNGRIYDCRGCSYEACRHFGEQGSCFYGGIITEQVFPALLASDALVLICPNYNDAVSANITAFINRLTSIFRSNDFSEKRVYALIVSGYSGGDIIAEQIIGAFGFNKSFILPPEFAILETANDPKSILDVPGIEERAGEFAGGIY